METRLYFAYGSNMDEIAMGARCPGSRFVETIEIRDKSFIINSLGWASILDTPGSSVFGVVWEITRSDEVELDNYEGLEENLYKKELISIELFGEKKEALVYIATNSDKSKDKSLNREYILSILSCAKRYGFPEEYIKEMESFCAID
jgi:gamma-glutamylcyclotransferase